MKTQNMLPIVCLLFCLLSGVSAAGTTPNLKEIFIGKCWEYQRLVNPAPFTNSSKNCTDLWQKFVGAFAYKSPCNTTSEDYRAFTEAADFDLAADRHLFWTGVFPFANDYSAEGKRYVTVVNTLIGYMSNGLYWCGQKEDPGINYDECPEFLACEPNRPGDYNFWLMASETYAHSAKGRANVMLNGSRAEPFRPTSIFATHEVANLVPAKGVTSMHIIVVHTLGGPVTESCGEGTLAKLAQQARDQGLTVTCENNPESVRHFQCTDDQHDSEECQFMGPTLNKGQHIVANCWIVALLVTLLSTCY